MTASNLCFHSIQVLRASKERHRGGANCAHFDASALLAWPVAPAPPRWAGPPAPKVSIPARAGPDELEAVFAFDFGEGCVDRSGEARIVQLDREVVAALFGGLLPGSTELGLLRCTAKCRLC